MLEAGRYYRQARDKDTAAIANYLRYLDRRHNDAEILTEFTQLCASVPEGELKPREKVALHLKAFGAERMGVKLLARYSRLSPKEETWLDIVSAVEQDEAKLVDKAFRLTYFRALHSLGEWEKIVGLASERERRTKPLALLIAEAWANLGNSREAWQIVQDYHPKDPDEMLGLMRTIYKCNPDADLDTLEGVRELDSSFLEFALMDPRRVGLAEKEDRGFRDWLKRLRRQLRKHYE